MNKQKHLKLEDRIFIESLLNQQHSFKSIARQLGKDCTTISKEVKAHTCFEKIGTFGRAFNDCRIAVLHQCSIQKICHHCAYSNNKSCWTCGRCTSSCISYEKYTCPELSKPPYVCNPCQKRTRCSLEKRLYKSSYAQKEYEQIRSESRSGFALSETERKQLDDVVSPPSHKRSVPASHLRPSRKRAHEIGKNPIRLYKQQALYGQGHRHAPYCPHASMKKCFQKA